jgi:hypothetical protein
MFSRARERVVTRVRRSVWIACVGGTIGTAAVAAANKPREQLNKADQAWAARIALHLNDFPSFGWQARKSSSHKVNFSCSQPHVSRLIVTGKASSDEIFQGDSQFAESVALVLKKPQQAISAYRASSKIASCVAAARHQTSIS